MNTMLADGNHQSGLPLCGPARGDNLSDPAKDAYYRQHGGGLAGLGTPRSARTIAVLGARVAWGITLLKEAPNKENAVKFLQVLLSPLGPHC